MVRRLERGAWWRFLCIVTLVFGLIARPSSVAASTSELQILAITETGQPVAGAVFGVYDAVFATDGTGALIAGQRSLAEPTETNTDGIARVSGLPNDLAVAVVQLEAPSGFTPLTSGLTRIAITDPARPVEVSFQQRPAAPVTDSATAPGTVEVIAASAETGAPVAGAEVGLYRLDPASGQAGSRVTGATTSGDGTVTFAVDAGEYVAILEQSPSGYNATTTPTEQRVTIQPAVNGVGDYDAVWFTLQTDPEPTSSPDQAPTSDASPPTTSPSPTPPSDPASTATPVTTPNASPTPSAGSDPAATPEPPATVIVEKLICVTENPDEIGTVRHLPGAAFQLVGDPLPPECRAATANEFTFALQDPGSPENPFDFVTLIESEATDAAGLVRMEVSAPGRGRMVFLIENENPSYFSEHFAIASGQTTSILTINYIAPPTTTLRITTTDIVTGRPVTGSCYNLAATGAASVTIAERCDGDDGVEDGAITFPNVANGAYTVTAQSLAPNFVAEPPATVELDGTPFDLPLAAIPYGQIEVLVFACPPIAGSDGQQPTPAPGDGLDVITGVGPVTIDDANDPVRFAVAHGGGITGDGTSIGARSADLELTEGCSPGPADLELVPFDEESDPIPIAVDSNGLGGPIAVPPAATDAPYRLRDQQSGAEVAIEVRPATLTTVTVAVAADTTDVAQRALITGATSPLIGGLNLTGASASVHFGPTLGGVSAYGVTSDDGPKSSALTANERLREVAFLPETGIGGASIGEMSTAFSWGFWLALVLLALGVILSATERIPRPRR